MMPVTDPATPIRRAVDELVTLALAVRADWQEHWIRGAISQGAAEGMTWPQVLVSLSRLMADPRAVPRDLLPDSRTPLAHRHVLPRDRNEGYAAAARADLLESIARGGEAS
jgi:hypothetical protein